MQRSSRIAAVTAALALATTLCTARAQAVELKVADSFPTGHYLVNLLLKPWMADVTKRTNGTVTFSYFPNQQLGQAADLLKLTQSGVVDIGYIAPAYVSDKMPLSDVAELPGEFDTSCQGTLAYWKTARTGILNKDEYTPNGIRLVLAIILPAYRVFTAKQAVLTLQDIQGLKLRTTGGAQDITTREIGAVPVRMSAPDAYQALSRGTLDGLLFPDESISSYGLTRLVRHASVGVSFGSFVVAFSISDRVWNSLTPAERKAMDDASEAIEPKACAEVDEAQAETRHRLEQAGVVYLPLTDDARKVLQAKLRNVGETWAADLDQRGKPGQAVLKEFNSLVGTQGAK